MPGFRFRLENVLRHRRNIERDRKRDLAEALARLGALQDELADIVRRMRQADADLRAGGLSGRLDMGFLAAHRRFMVSMRQKALGLAQKIRAAQAEVEQARAAVVQAATDRKVMEKLRERKLAAWMERVSAQQDRAYDEIGMRLYWETQHELSGGPAASPDASDAAESGGDA